MKKIIALLMCMALLLAGCGGGAQSEDSTSAPFSIDSYKESVSDSVNSVYESAVLFGNIANYENNYWEAAEKLNSFVTPEKLFERAMEWLEEKTGDTAETVKAQYDENTEKYKAIVSTDIEGTEAEEIKETYKEYFDAYIALYNLINSPSVNKSDFVNNYNDCVNTISNCSSKLEILLS